MNIGCFTTSYFPFTGGAEICIHNLLTQFVSHGHEVTLYAPFWSYIHVKAPFKIVPMFPKSDILFKRASIIAFPMAAAYLDFMFKRNKHDVIHIHMSFPAAYILRNKCKHIPRVLTCHGADIQKRPEYNYGLRIKPETDTKISVAIKSMDYLVAISEDIKREMIALGIVDESRIKIIHNGASWSRFEKRIDKKKVRKYLGIEEDIPLILTTGRNHPKKGFFLIPQIAKDLKNKGLKFKWLIVGDGNDELIPLIEKYKVSDKLILHKEINVSGFSEINFPKETLIDIYLASDIYAFPSLLEGLPLVLPEAMAAGTAIVTTDAPGCIDVITHNETGFIAEKNNVKDFSKKLESVIGNTNLRQKLAGNAKLQKSVYDWEVIARQYENLFEEAILYKNQQSLKLLNENY